MTEKYYLFIPGYGLLRGFFTTNREENQGVRGEGGVAFANYLQARPPAVVAAVAPMLPAWLPQVHQTHTPTLAGGFVGCTQCGCCSVCSRRKRFNCITKFVTILENPVAMDKERNVMTMAKTRSSEF